MKAIRLRLTIEEVSVEAEQDLRAGDLSWAYVTSYIVVGADEEDVIRQSYLLKRLAVEAAELLGELI